MLAKLDSYDYEIEPNKIRIHICGINDPDLVDIMSEIERSRGRIYVESRFFDYLDYRIGTLETGQAYMDLHVEESS